MAGLVMVVSGSYPIPGRVFVVDDEETLRTVMVDVLRGHGYDVSAFASGEEALVALDRTDADVLLTDLSMPGLNGLDLIQRAVRIDPRLVCLILTGNASVDSAVEAMRNGVFDYIQKPFRVPVILSAVERALHVRRLRQENIELMESQGVFELAATAAFSLDEARLRENVTDAALQQCGANEASLLVPSADGDGLEVVVVRGEGREALLGQRVRAGQGVAGWVAMARERLTLEGEVHDPRFAPLHPRSDIVAAMSVPLVAGGNLMGVVNVNRTHGHRPFTVGQAKALSILAGLAASGMEAASAHARTHAAEVQYHSLFENVQEGLFRARENGEIVLANPAFARMMGYADVQALLADQGARSVALLATGQRQALGAVRSSEDTLSFETQVRRKDGSDGWHAITLRSVRAPDGGVQHLDGTAMDVTRRRQSEEESRRRSEQLQALRKIDMAITASLDLRVTLDVFLTQVVEQLKPDAADVLLYDFHSQVLECSRSVGFRGDTDPCPRLRLGQGVAGLAAKERKTRFIPLLDLDSHACDARPCVRQEGFISACAAPLLVKGHVQGVLQVFFRRRFDPDAVWLAFLEAMAGQAAIALDNASLFSDLDRSNAELAEAYETTLEGWSRALDLRDKETEGHSRRVTELAVALARACGMSREGVAHVRRGALLHDLGKMGVPDHVLLKPGPLNDDEWAVMRRHTTNAFELLAPIPYLRWAVDIPYCHHEKWDGTGYPRGLKGDQIPLSARVFAVVDVWDALTNDRPYRAAMDHEKALGIIRDGSGTYFEPRIVDAFLALVTSGRPEADLPRDGRPA